MLDCFSRLVPLDFDIGDVLAVDDLEPRICQIRAKGTVPTSGALAKCTISAEFGAAPNLDPPISL